MANTNNTIGTDNTNNEQKGFSLDFYIYQFRQMFRRIFIIYGLCAFIIFFLFYKINTRPALTYYAASESGVLKPVVAYSENQAKRYQQGQ